MSDITIYLTSDLTSSERKISPQWNLKHLKSRLEQITGIEPKSQTVLLYAIPNSNEYIKIIDANKYDAQKDEIDTVVSLNIVPFSRLHVEDANPNSELKQLVDNGDVETYDISEEAYTNRTDSVLNWKQQNKLGRFDPRYMSEQEKKAQLDDEVVEHMKVGDRCRIINIGGERRGAIRYIGKIPQLDKGEGNWVGIEFDEPTGKNNGSVDGKVYFQCRDKHGSFVKPKKVQVGDYPELDPFEDEEM